MGFGTVMSVEAATRLAHLLADTRGAEILAEMQKLNNSRWRSQTRSSAADIPGDTAAETATGGGVQGGTGNEIGIWAAERTDTGVALRRREGMPEWWRWAHVEYIPPQAGARRLAMVGESAARGWLMEPAFTPTDVLARHLDADPREYQCVDLARSNADLEIMGEVVRNLPIIEPDVVIIFAGNNFGFAPLEESYRDQLAEALRSGGYPVMRQYFIDSVVLPRVDRFLADVARLRSDHGIDVIMVVPETNLRGWEPAPEVEVPAMSHAAMDRWYRLYRDATVARDEARWDDVREIAAKMSDLDRGLGTVSWYLQGRAAENRGDGTEARRLLELARDAGSGLLLDHPPNVITKVREREIQFARDNGIRYIDLADALASTDLPELPDPRFFLDFVHLNDEGMERAMCRVADAVMGKPEGTTPPGPGADPATRAIGHSLGSGFCALRNQPSAVVREQLEFALAADEQTTRQFINSYLSALESHGVRWIHSEVANMLRSPQAFQLCLHIAQARSHSRGFWVFREVVQEVLGRAPATDKGGWQSVDLLKAADTRGFRAPNFTPGKAYFEATSKRTRLAIALDRPQDGTLRLTYRLRRNGGEGAAVEVNGVRVGTLAYTDDWLTERLEVPSGVTRAGVNWIAIDWPVPHIDDVAMWEADASALARRQFPSVLPVFGALFEAFFCREEHPAAGRNGSVKMAARTDASMGWRETETVA